MTYSALTKSKKHTNGISVSYFKAITDKNSSPIQIGDVLSIIKKGSNHKNLIERLRREKTKTKADSIKKNLPAITPSGLFNGQRKIEHLIEYSGFICLDFDNVNEPTSEKTKLIHDPFCKAVFISPSGTGIKVFVKVPFDKNKHLEHFNSLGSYFAKKYNLKIDKSCKDITRLMLLSLDEDSHVNDDSKVWDSIEYENFLFEWVLNKLGAKELFEKGNRNNFIFRLACLCSKQNIAKTNCENNTIERFESEDFNKDEILRTITSAYNGVNNEANNKNENNKSISRLARVEKYIITKYEIRFNEVSTQIEFRENDTATTFRVLNENSLSRELEHNNIVISMNKLTSLLQSDFISSYNPFQEYFTGLTKWDHNEPDYISMLTSFVPVKDPERFKCHFKKMLVRCIACALDDKVFNKQVFVLVHDMQNSGKSTFCRWLCPPNLSNYIAENINTDKDSIIALATNFFINMDELATLPKTEINSLKTFISKDKINLRLPYGRKAIIMPRRANFIGSTNKDEFLTDETGSVRWLCFELTGAIDFGYKDDIDINNIWRQAYTLYLDGFSYQLTAKEIEENEGANKSFQVNTFEMEIIPKYYSPSSKEEGGLFVTATDVFNKISLAYPLIKFNLPSLGKAMKLLKFKREQEYLKDKKESRKGYFAIELPI